MQDKIKKIGEKIFFFTTDPDRDWRRMFSLLVLFVIISFIWNIYFFFNVREDIRAADAVQANVPTSTVGQEDEVKKTINLYNAKAAKNKALFNWQVGDRINGTGTSSPSSSSTNR